MVCVCVCVCVCVTVAILAQGLAKIGKILPLATLRDRLPPQTAPLPSRHPAADPGHGEAAYTGIAPTDMANIFGVRGPDLGVDVNLGTLASRGFADAHDRTRPWGSGRTTQAHWSGRTDGTLRDTGLRSYTTCSRRRRRRHGRRSEEPAVKLLSLRLLFLVCAQQPKCPPGSPFWRPGRTKWPLDGPSYRFWMGSL